MTVYLRLSLSPSGAMGGGASKEEVAVVLPLFHATSDAGLAPASLSDSDIGNGATGAEGQRRKEIPKRTTGVVLSPLRCSLGSSCPLKARCAVFSELSTFSIPSLNMPVFPLLLSRPVTRLLRSAADVAAAARARRDEEQVASPVVTLQFAARGLILTGDIQRPGGWQKSTTLPPATYRMAGEAQYRCREREPGSLSSDLSFACSVSCLRCSPWKNSSCSSSLRAKTDQHTTTLGCLSLIHISEPTRPRLI
eukprot:182842-Rhodomonas_salina.1